MWNSVKYWNSSISGERYDFVINADQAPGAYWIQLRGLGECGIKRAQNLAILRYARGPYQPTSAAPTYDLGLPQGVVSREPKMATQFYQSGSMPIFYCCILTIFS